MSFLNVPRSVVIKMDSCAALSVCGAAAAVTVEEARARWVTELFGSGKESKKSLLFQSDGPFAADG